MSGSITHAHGRLLPSTISAPDLNLGTLQPDLCRQPLRKQIEAIMKALAVPRSTAASTSSKANWRFGDPI